MAVKVYIPTPFRRATANAARVDVDAGDVKELLDALEGRFEGLRGLVRDASGQVHHHVNLYVNGEEIGMSDVVRRARGARETIRVLRVQLVLDVSARQETSLEGVARSA